MEARLLADEAIETEAEVIAAVRIAAEAAVDAAVVEGIVAAPNTTACPQSPPRKMSLSLLVLPRKRPVPMASQPRLTRRRKSSTMTMKPKMCVSSVRIP